MASLVEVGIAVTAACLATTAALGVTNFLRIRRLDREVQRVDQEVREILRRSPDQAR